MKVIKRFNIFIHRGCNLDCYFCPEKKVNIKMSYRDIDKILNLLEDIFKNNILIENLKFFGGEPLLNFKFIQIFLEKLYKRFGKLDGKIIKIRLTTNGWLLNDEMIDFLNRYNIRVNVSLNGYKEVYEKDRGLVINEKKWSVFIEKLKKIDTLFVNFNVSPLVVIEGFLENFKYIYNNITNNINILPVYFVYWSKKELVGYLQGLVDIYNFVKDKEIYLENYENYSFMPLHNFGINIDVDGKIYFSSYIVELEEENRVKLLLKDYKDILEAKKIKKFIKILESLQRFKYPRKFLKINSYLDQGLNLFLSKVKNDK